jgi:hypothetical protein
LFEAGGIGSPWWKITRYFIRTDSVTARLLLGLIARQHQYDFHSLLCFNELNSPNAFTFTVNRDVYVLCMVMTAAGGAWLCNASRGDKFVVYFTVRIPK